MRRRSVGWAVGSAPGRAGRLTSTVSDEESPCTPKLSTGPGVPVLAVVVVVGDDAPPPVVAGAVPVPVPAPVVGVGVVDDEVPDVPDVPEDEDELEPVGVPI